MKTIRNIIGIVALAMTMSLSASAQNNGAEVVNRSESGNLTLNTNGALYVGNYVSVMTSNGKFNFSFHAEIIAGESPNKAVKVEFSQFLFGVPADFKCTLTPSGVAKCSGKEQ